STSLRRRNVWRGVSATRLLWRQLGLCVPDYAVVALDGLRRDHDAALPLLLHRPRHGELLLREAHAAELNGEPLQAARVAPRRVGAGARDLGHRPEAVQDRRREPDLLGELAVDVDRVEVAGRARV